MVIDGDEDSKEAAAAAAPADAPADAPAAAAAPAHPEEVDDGGEDLRADLGDLGLSDEELQ